MYILSSAGYVLATAALLSIDCLAQRVDVDLVTEPVMKERLQAGLVPMRQRQAAIGDLFTHVGCKTEEQRVDKHWSNVVCTLPGETASTIIAGGHFDFVDYAHGTGVVDDWSGASLLPSLYQALKGRPRKHTYVFVAFAREEDGLVGSSRYVRNLAPGQRAAVRAFVNLECLGLGPVKVWVSRSTPDLMMRLAEVGAAIHADLRGVNVDRVGDDDTHPFLDAHIPEISIHSITEKTLPILHSERDKMSAIDLDQLYTAYRLVAFYLAYLDVKSD